MTIPTIKPNKGRYVNPQMHLMAPRVVEEYKQVTTAGPDSSSQTIGVPSPAGQLDPSQEASLKTSLSTSRLAWQGHAMPLVWPE